MRTVAAESTNQKPRSTIRKQYEQISKTCRWWYCKITPPGYKWKPKSRPLNVEPNVSNLRTKSRTTNISEPTTLRKSIVSNPPSSSNSFAALKFINDQIALILGYGDRVQGNVTIKRVYYVEGLNPNLFSVGQFCDADLEVSFQKSTCYIRDLKGNDLLTGSRGTDLYSITFQDTSTPNPICLMAIASSSQAWLWHHRLSHLNFDTINLLSKYDTVNGLPKLKFIKDHLCSSCELRKAKRKSFKTKKTSSSKRRLQILYIDLCGPMRVESFNDETPEVLINFLKLVQRGLHAQVRTVQTDKGIEFLNKTLHPYFAQEGIEHQTLTARTPKQNGVNRSLVIPRHEKTPYHIINGQKPSVKFFHTFGSFCYIVWDGENLDKMKEKGDACIFVGLSPGPQSQENVPQAAETVTTSNELDLLFILMFGELLIGTTTVVSKSSVVTTIDAPNQHQQQNTTPSTSTTVVVDIPPLNIQTTPGITNQAPTQAPTVTANEKIIQAETNK
ncbi:retrovirus-related pol polyprotein from transposon TNT 1-94, partial [Tanacetum coccineum]